MLPSEPSFEQTTLIDVERRRPLHPLDEVSERHRRGDVDQRVHVIRRAAGRQEAAAGGAGLRAEDGDELVVECRREPSAAMPCRPHEVHENARS